jgi:predicted PurR-regulated permease PerM
MKEIMKVTEASRNVLKAFLVLLIVVFIANFILIGPYLLAVFLGWLLSTVLGALHTKLLDRGWKRGPASLVATLVATFTIILPIVGFGIVTVKNLIRVIGPLMKDGMNVDLWVEKVETFPLARRFFDNSEEIRAFLTEASRVGGERVLKVLTGILSGAPEVILQLVLALLTCYFVLRDGHTLKNWASPRMPLPPETKKGLACSLNDIAYSSFLSMFVASIAQAIIILIGFLILKVPMAPLAFGLAFVFAWFPIFGVTPVWAAAVIYLLAVDRSGAAIGMVACGFVASLSDNIVRRWVIKGRSDVHPLVSLVSIFGAIYFFGIFGVLVGPIFAACLIELLRQWPLYSQELGLDPKP